MTRIRQLFLHLDILSSLGRGNRLKGYYLKFLAESVDVLQIS